MRQRGERGDQLAQSLPDELQLRRASIAAERGQLRRTEQKQCHDVVPRLAGGVGPECVRQHRLSACWPHKVCTGLVFRLVEAPLLPHQGLLHGRHCRGGAQVVENWRQLVAVGRRRRRQRHCADLRLEGIPRPGVQDSGWPEEDAPLQRHCVRLGHHRHQRVLRQRRCRAQRPAWSSAGRHAIHHHASGPRPPAKTVPL